VSTYTAAAQHLANRIHIAVEKETKEGKHGKGLREWYKNRGFQEVERMPNVRWKFGMWVGVGFCTLVCVMQRTCKA
jgi:hypothetical protein